MPKFDVNFDVRYYNGTIEVEAATAAEAQEIVENMSLAALVDATCDVGVDVESVEVAEEN